MVNVINSFSLPHHHIIIHYPKSPCQKERDRAFAKLRELGIDPETL
ncbi:MULTISPECIES: hypothetical protein [Limnospira]|nr:MULTISPECIES: hypothetical protein [Limnospira]EKD08872.1 hypothetical protein SPLC1_S202730 [Arthrospira platensis C1]MDC0838236.1 hypothetical protein [Limnoraphis robusta]MDT9262862.1 hypothetical protein [Limnospira sp. PMC 1223.20]QNH57458.1 MAG: hypothetical protein H2674_25810 [Limnospira indica BM01]